MKKTVMIIALLSGVINIASAGGRHYHNKNNSDLVIKADNYGRFTATVDGQAFYAHAGELCIDRMSVGYHTIEIVRETRGRHGIYRVKGVTEIYVPAHSKVYATVNRAARLLVDNVEEKVYRDVYKHCSTLAEPLFNDEFEYILSKVNRTGLQDDKRDIIERTAAEHSLSSEQLAVFMRTLQFEKDRLYIAKSAYDNIVDKEKFRIVFDELNYEISKRELQDYITHKR